MVEDGKQHSILCYHPNYLLPLGQDEEKQDDQMIANTNAQTEEEDSQKEDLLQNRMGMLTSKLVDNHRVSNEISKSSLNE